VIGQTANILLYLGSRHGLAPKAEAGKLGVQPAAAHGWRISCWKFTTPITRSGRRCITRISATLRKKRTGEFLAATRAEIFWAIFERLLKDSGGAWAHRPADDLCRSVAVPRSSKGCATHFQTRMKGVPSAEFPGPRRAARPRRGAAEDQGRYLSKRPAHRLQRGRHFSGTTRRWICELPSWPGLDPGIHVLLFCLMQRRGWPGQARP